jgi:hypothetical protein
VSYSRSTEVKSLKLLRRIFALNQFTIAVLVVIALIAVLALIYYSQTVAERNLLDAPGQKEQYEIAKLAAEIRQIRSDTSGSLFWLKLFGLLVTIASAVGGYLLGQSRNTKKRLAFEHNKDVDAAYQSIVQGLSEESAVLRATAAVKLGAILKSFPTEWDVPDDRQQQMIRLTKEVLAAALALESDPKVLKTLTIALVLHKPGENVLQQGTSKYADARNLDLSEAKAIEAYWAKVDFSNTDFYRANLARTSLRLCILNHAQFYSTDLSEAILAEAQGEETRLKFCDLRNADLSGASLLRANFEGAKVHGVRLTGATIKEPVDVQVDNSKDGDRSQMTSVYAWLRGDG